jgi:D-alanine-D-alanine ligase
MGGYTSEHDISLKSGAVVMAHIDKEVYDPYSVRIDKDAWLIEVGGSWKPIDIADFSSGEIRFDAVFNVVHGKPGENGELQAYFDSLQIPYTGCAAKVSSLTYNKSKTLEYLAPHGIAMATRIVLSARDTIDTQQIVEKVGLPCFVKANQAGSSFGVSKVYQEDNLRAAIEIAKKEDSGVLIESFLQGTEVSIGVITFQSRVRVLAPTEIITDEDFFDFSAKYEGKSEEITPARLTEPQFKALRITAEKVYSVLGMKGMSRSDFIFVGDVPHFLEINTIPGLTEESLLPQQAKYAGISLRDLFGNALVEAMEK